MNKYRQLSPQKSDIRSRRCENKDTSRQRSLGYWVDIEVRSVVRCDATRRIEGAGSIGLT